MKRWFKILVSFIITIVIALSIAMALLIYYVDPDQLKTPIQNAVLQRTGYELKLQGPLRWKWYPMLSLEITKLCLDNQAPFSAALIAADTLTVNVSLWSLLTGHVVLDFDMEGATLVLERNAAGQENWAALRKAFETPSQSTEKTAALPMPSLAVNSLNVHNAQFIYHDQQKNQHYRLSRLSLNAHGLVQGLLQGSNPIALGFDVEELNKRPLGSFSLKGYGSLAQSPQSFQLQDLQVRLSPASGTSIELNGSIKVEDFRDPRIHGHFDHVALKNKEGLSLQGTLKADFTAKPAMGTLEADLSSDRLTIGAIDFEAIRAHIQANKGFLSIAPLDFKMNGALQHLTLKGRLDGARPQWSLTQSGEAFDLKTILSFVDPKGILEGKATLGLALSAEGTALETIERTLCGKMNLQVKEGKIHHLDLASLIKKALSSIHDQIAKRSGQNPTALVEAGPDATLAATAQTWDRDPLNPAAFTPFDSLNATLNFENGVATNPDLSITQAAYRITGGGTLDLVRHQLDYKASAVLTTNPYPASDEIGTYLFQTPLPIQIKGSLQAPSIQPDLGAYLHSTLQYLQKNKVEQLIHQTIDKTLGHFLKQRNGQ
jgi:AsmA protein